MAFGGHWLLADEQSNYLADLAHKALATTGTKYASIRKYLEKYTPWIALSIGFAQVIGPRIEETQRLRSAPVEEWPSAIATENPGNPIEPVRERSDVDGHGQEIGGSDTFRPFGGAD